MERTIRVVYVSILSVVFAGGILWEVGVDAPPTSSYEGDTLTVPALVWEENVQARLDKVLNDPGSGESSGNGARLRDLSETSSRRVSYGAFIDPEDPSTWKEVRGPVSYGRFIDPKEEMSQSDLTGRRDFGPEMVPHVEALDLTGKVVTYGEIKMPLQYEPWLGSSAAGITQYGPNLAGGDGEVLGRLVADNPPP